MSRPKYFIKTEVMVYGGRTKYYVVKGFSDDDQIAKVGSERDATKLCEEFERLTDEVAHLKSQVDAAVKLRAVLADLGHVRIEGEGLTTKLIVLQKAFALFDGRMEGGAS